MSEKSVKCLFLYFMKKFSETKNNFLRDMHRKKKYICSVFSVFKVVHDESVTNPMGILSRILYSTLNPFEPMSLLKGVVKFFN